MSAAEVGCELGGTGGPVDRRRRRTGRARGGGLLSLAAGLFAADLAGTWVTSHASLSGDRMARLIGMFRPA
jgi:hypothetical protein